MNYLHSTQKLTLNTSFKSDIYVDKIIDNNNGQVRRLQHYWKMKDFFLLMQKLKTESP